MKKIYITFFIVFLSFSTTTANAGKLGLLKSLFGTTAKTATGKAATRVALKRAGTVYMSVNDTRKVLSMGKAALKARHATGQNKRLAKLGIRYIPSR